MKRSIITSIIIYLPLLLLAQSNNVIIEGQIIGYKGTKPLKYSISPYYGTGNNASIQPDSQGRFKIIHSLKDTEFFTFYFSEENSVHECKLILQPGKHYSLISTGRDEADWDKPYSPDIFQLISKGDISKSYSIIDRGQMLYNIIDNGTRGQLYHDQWDLSKPDSLITELINRNQIELNQFQQLLNSGSIDQNFFDIAKLNIEYTNSYRLAQTIQDSWSSGRYKINDTVQLKKLINIYPKIFELYPVENVELTNHYCFDRYIDLYMEYLDDCLGGSFVPNSYQDFNAIPHKLKSKEFLLEDTYKVYHMITTANYALNLGTNSHILLKKHLDDNPDIISDDFAFYLYNMTIPIAESYNRINDSLLTTALPEKAVVLDKNRNIENLEQLCSLTNSKPLLIDLWGSWCGPCKYQFQFQDSLKAFLAENNIKMVYAAQEYESTRESWIMSIKRYKLEGYHFILTDRFIEDLSQNGAKVTNFPTYIIVNEEGKVVEPEAFLPSQTKLLIQQLKLKLNL